MVDPTFVRNGTQSSSQHPPKALRLSHLYQRGVPFVDKLLSAFVRLPPQLDDRLSKRLVADAPRF